MLSLSLARLLYTLYRFLHLPLQNTLLGLLATKAFLQCLHTFSEDFSSVSIKENIILSLMLVSTNNFKNETDLRLQLYDSPTMLILTHFALSHTVLLSLKSHET